MYNPRGLKLQEQGQGKDLQSLQSHLQRRDKPRPHGHCSVSPTQHLLLWHFAFSNAQVPPESPPWQGLTLPGDSSFALGTIPARTTSGDTNPRLERAQLESHSSSSHKTEQILRRAELKSCSFYITPYPALAHLH